MMADSMQRDDPKGPAGNGGVLADARLLAAGAAGLAAAFLMLWSLRGLPGGMMALWLTALPLFLAGIGFGAVALVGAVIIGSIALLVAGGSFAFGVFLLAFAVPVLLLVLLASPRGGGLRLSFALLGVIPAAGILVAAFLLADQPGGLEGALRRAAETGAARMGMAVGEGMLADLARVKAAAIGFWVMLALLINAAAAGGLLVRAGVIGAAPAWRQARLPVWYPALPALAALIWLVTDSAQDAVPLSVTLALMVPVFLHGLAAFHRVTMPLRGRTFLLAIAYGALLLMAVPVAFAATAFGLFDILHGNRARPTVP